VDPDPKHCFKGNFQSIYATVQVTWYYLTTKN
jgi:hypothetical protein